MSQSKAVRAVGRIRGPHDGVVELIILQPVDWESDPFLVKDIRDKIKKNQDYIASEEFRQAYPGCQGVIVVETPHFPPEELQELLTKAGAEVRIAQSSSVPVSSAPAPKSSPATSSAPAPKSSPAASKAETTKSAVSKSDASIVSKSDASTPVSSEPAPKKPTFVVRTSEPEPEPWELEIDDDPYASGMAGAAVGSGRSPAVLALGGLCGVFVLGLLYGLFLAGSTPPVPPPRVIPARSISAATLPKEVHATVSVHPNPRTFVLIPMQTVSATGKGTAVTGRSFYLLFGVKESPNLLIFASQADSKIVKEIKMVPRPLHDDQVPKPIWKSDLVGGAKVQARVYTGRLERAQRRPHGPVELVLPDENRDINKIYQRLGIKFSKDTMILVVGEKPHPPTNHSGLIILVCFLGALFSGGAAFVFLTRSRRAF